MVHAYTVRQLQCTAPSSSSFLGCKLLRQGWAGCQQLSQLRLHSFQRLFKRCLICIEVIDIGCHALLTLLQTADDLIAWRQKVPAGYWL